MNRAERRRYEKEGNRLIKKHKGAAQLVREDAIRQMCKGEYNTPFYVALANVAMDYKEGKITKDKYDELTAHLTLNVGVPESE